MKRLYELTYLIPGELPEKEIETIPKKLDSFITETKGVFYTPPLISQDKQIKKNGNQMKKPFYFEKERGVSYLKKINFYFDSENIEWLKQKLKQEKQILRFMLLTKKESEMKTIKKPKKAKIKPIFRKTGGLPASAKSFVDKKKPKIELKEIDKKLDEILNQE